MAEPRYRVEALLEFATALFAAAGCDGDKPAAIAAGLVEADRLGHTTHGLQLAPTYLNELAAGTMTATGEPDVVAERPAVATWDGRKLPGVWLAAKAVRIAFRRVSSWHDRPDAGRRTHA